MYHKFYGFNESPFNLTPNSKYFFESAKHTEALSTLLYAINQRKGFCVVTGNIGSGKTTVCRRLINELDSKTQVALVTNSQLGARDLLLTILDDLEIQYEKGSKSKLLAQFNEYLINQIMKDNNVVLIIDEAQNLTPSVLEEVRMLSNLETENEKLLQIVFLGQPELKRKLAMPKLEQLRQRIAVYFHLTPLDKEDTRRYILHRLKVASGNGHDVFSEDAIDAIFAFSQGVPRLINQICDSALLTGYVKESKQITAEIVNEVIGESPMVQITDTKLKYKEGVSVA